MSSIIENEVKILDIDAKKLRKKLKKLGAKKQFSGHIHDIYYDYPDKQVHQEKKRIRIRRKGEASYLTLKKKLDDQTIRSCYEHEFTVECPQRTHKSLLNEGLFPVREKKKKRISYTYKDVIFDIDLYQDMPAILEIEAKNEKKIMKWIKKLGLQNKKTAAFGSRGLFAYYGKAVSYL